MPSRADATAAAMPVGGVSTDRTLQRIGAGLHAVALACMALLLWRLLMPVSATGIASTVTQAGTLDAGLASLLRSPTDTLDVTLSGVPAPHARAALRALRGSGHTVRLRAASTLPALAVAAEDEWRALGGTRILVAGSDSLGASVSDGAGALDSLTLSSGGNRSQSGPVQGLLRVDAPTVRASVMSLRAGSPDAARVLVLGDATWESRFLVSTLEEAGWPVDMAVTLSPRVTISQGAARAPVRNRHAIVVLLQGAPASSIAALPQFVRDGGGLVIVGEAARNAGLASLRAGAPGATIAGELGAEASTEPRHGLDLVPVASLAAGSITLESRDGRVAVAARRVGAGRVLQVGYDNSWLWRMAGNDDAPVAHRRWWTTLLSSVVPLSVPLTHNLSAEHDTVDAAPVAALARDLGLPAIGTATLAPVRENWRASLDPRWLLALALLSLVASWTLRRWRGLT